VDVGARLSASLEVPTIGIGAGPHCDGQVLVCYDLLGLYGDLRPKFVKRYAELGDTVKGAVARYAEEVRTGVFPGPEHSFAGKPRGLTDATGQTPIVSPAAPVYGPDTRED
jgi:3-methyl-2-oxobutanoate hydroxymethyltransferase